MAEIEKKEVCHLVAKGVNIRWQHLVSLCNFADVLGCLAVALLNNSYIMLTEVGYVYWN